MWRRLWRWAETDTLEDPKVTTVAGAAELGWVEVKESCCEVRREAGS